MDPHPDPTRLQPVALAGADAAALRWRRRLVLALNLATVGGLIATMAAILSAGGWSLADVILLPAFALTLPWLSIGLWNAVIGFVVMATARDPALAVAPVLAPARGADPVRGRLAVTMTLRHEDAARALARLRALQQSLDAALADSGSDQAVVHYHVLSDSGRPDVADAEARLVAAWAADDPSLARRLFYRRRQLNTGFKAGNIREFLERTGDAYDLFLPLDADSVMAGGAVLRLWRVMQARPQLGILQGLVVGMPAASAFARVFQFGMRHGMRSYTLGSAWWQGDCGPYWGHNALIRVAAFREHCHLPVLPGAPPLGGPILSHDQVEAVLMRRAGLEVRVWADEDDSWEENPPSLPDFVRRDLRWCQGNMQYWQLLGMPGLPLLSRVQLMLAILMYLGAPGWMVFISVGTLQLALGVEAAPLTVDLGIGLFIAIIAMALAPKLMGVAGVLLSGARRRAYGGAGRVLVGAMLEFLHGSLLAPVIGFAQARFMAGLVRGRRILWEAQNRDVAHLPLAAALAGLWPQAVFGALILAVVAVTQPPLLWWVSPVVVALLTAAPLASLTAWPPLGRLTQRLGLFDVPEDRALPPTLAAVPGLEAWGRAALSHPTAHTGTPVQSELPRAA